MAALVCILFFTSCTQAPKASPPAETEAGKSAPAGPVSGKTAFWEMYKSAHAWAADLTPLALESKAVPGTKGVPEIKTDSGKAEMWSATFGSPRKNEARTFLYSAAVRPPDVVKGVTVGRALPWSGPTQDALPFETADFKVDSDAAYQAALAQAAAWVKKHPGQEASLALGNASRFDGPVWCVRWGDNKSGYTVFVSARSGAVIK
ncbi:MAG: hypothetical protein ACHP79_01730 [Terriglobales bacterium]